MHLSDLTSGFGRFTHARSSRRNRPLETSGSSRDHRGSSKFSVFREPTEEELKVGLGELIGTLPIPTVEADVINAVEITEFKPVVSYSWQDQKDPHIIVPGHPLIWRDRPLPYTVERNSSTVFVDQNAFFLGASPFLPLFASIMHHSPDFPLETVDFVTDRNGLRKLWRWAAGNSYSSSLRIDVEMVRDKTILMRRWEPVNTQPAGLGYDLNFEKASTKSYPGCENSTGHHRIVSYNLDGLHMLVRYKADACLPTGTTSSSAAADQGSDIPSVDELATTLQNSLSLSLANQKPTTETVVKKIPSSKETLSITIKGELPPQSSLIEIKTRSIHSTNRMNWEDTYFQLLLSQTPSMFICLHEHGTFKEVQTKSLQDLSQDEKIAKSGNEGLQLLRKILEAIQDVVLAQGEGAKLSLICKKGGKEIQVFDRKGKGRIVTPGPRRP